MTEASVRRPWLMAPYFLVEDVVATANFYRDVLGFEYEGFWGEPPSFCMVRRKGTILMLSQVPSKGIVRPNHVANPHRHHLDAYVCVDDADALCREFETKGLRIVRGPCDESYGMREFEIDDCNGYRICFGHDISARESA